MCQLHLRLAEVMTARPHVSQLPARLLLLRWCCILRQVRLVLVLLLLLQCCVSWLHRDHGQLLQLLLLRRHHHLTSHWHLLVLHVHRLLLLLRIWVQQRLLQHRRRRQQHLLRWLLLLQPAGSPGRWRVPATAQLLLHVMWCCTAEVPAEAVDSTRLTWRGQGPWSCLPAGAQEGVIINTHRHWRQLHT
jgi:hypothetical protein